MTRLQPRAECEAIGRLRLRRSSENAFRCGHQVGAAYVQRPGNSQDHRERGHVGPALNLAHMGTIHARQDSEFVLSKSLLHPGCANGHPEGSGWLSFV